MCTLIQGSLERSQLGSLPLWVQGEYCTSWLRVELEGLQHPTLHHLGHLGQGPRLQPCHQDLQAVHPGEIFYHLPSYQGVPQPEVGDLHTLSPPGQKPSLPEEEKTRQMRWWLESPPFPKFFTSFQSVSVIFKIMCWSILLPTEEWQHLWLLRNNLYGVNK